MLVALPRFDPVVGDLASNAAEMHGAVTRAVAGGADIVLLPELSLCGYPPRDLLLRDGFIDRCAGVVDELATELPADVLVLVGAPIPGKGGVVHNAWVALRDGVRIGAAVKRLMPDYDVFDEDRWFAPGIGPTVVEHAGMRLGLLICEDLWQGDDAEVDGHWTCDPVADVLAEGCDALLAASASPWVEGKHARQRERTTAVARRAGVPVATINQAGANDDLIFGGDAMMCDDRGRLVLYRPPFATGPVMAELGGSPISEVAPPLPAPDAQRCRALMTAVSGYVEKVGAPGVLVGLSGGIDSALTATIAVAALGGQRVTGVCMPSRYSSERSRTDAEDLARALGMPPPTVIAIEEAHVVMRSMLREPHPELEDGDLTDQNLQARLRGMLLMAMSNATGNLVLATGNKSELSVGYTTLYGDMCGALAMLGDVVKTSVWSIARWINAHFEEIGLACSPIPISSIERPPTAELAPDQCDQDSLPPYEELDAIIHHIVDYDRSVEETAARTGLDLDLVRRWTEVIDRFEFKRNQAAVIPKVARRSFGPGRRWPIVARPGNR